MRKSKTKQRRQRTNIEAQEEMTGALYLFALRVEAMVLAGDLWSRKADAPFLMSPAKREALTEAMDTILAGFKYAKVEIQ